MKQLISIVCLIGVALCAAYSYQECNSSYYLNTAELSCQACSTNQIANTYQDVAISCHCANGFIVGTNAACTAVNSTVCNIANSYFSVYGLNGANS